MGKLLSRITLCGGLALFAFPSGYGQEKAQAPCVLCLPTPAELFAATAKVEKVRWRSFFRAPVFPEQADRYSAAFALGGIFTDVYIAVEARDSQQVRNVSQDLSAELGGLGLDEKLAIRMKAMATFADAEEWSAIRFELEATTNEIRHHLESQLDHDLVILAEAGMTLRALAVCCHAVPEKEDDAFVAFIGGYAGELLNVVGQRVGMISDTGKGQAFVVDLVKQLEECQKELTAAPEVDRESLARLEVGVGKMIDRIKGRSEP